MWAIFGVVMLVIFRAVRHVGDFSGRLASFCSGHLPQLCECRVFVRKGETVNALGFRIWIDLCRFYKSVADLKSVSTADTNYFVTNARIRATAPYLLVNGSISFAGDPPVCEAVSPKLRWQRLVGTAFLT